MGKVNQLGRVLLVTVVAANAGCAGFASRLTPSGGKCIDMPVVPFGHEEMLNGAAVTRIKPVASSLRAETPAERENTIREAACDAGGDLIVEALQQEVILPTRKAIRWSGYAAKYVRAAAK